MIQVDSETEYNRIRTEKMKLGIHVPKFGPEIFLAEMSDLNLKRTIALAKRQDRSKHISMAISFWRFALPYFEAEWSKREL